MQPILFKSSQAQKVALCAILGVSLKNHLFFGLTEVKLVLTVPIKVNTAIESCVFGPH